MSRRNLYLATLGLTLSIVLGTPGLVNAQHGAHPGFPGFPSGMNHMMMPGMNHMMMPHMSHHMMMPHMSHHMMSPAMNGKMMGMMKTMPGMHSSFTPNLHMDFTKNKFSSFTPNFHHNFTTNPPSGFTPNMMTNFTKGMPTGGSPVMPSGSAPMPSMGVPAGTSTPLNSMPASTMPGTATKTKSGMQSESESGSP
jgi:hypothetical protein